MEDGNPPLSNYYIWEVPGKPVTVYLSLDVVDALGSEVLQGLTAVPGFDMETGGILLGRLEPREGGMLVCVERFEALRVEQRRGPFCALTENDRKVLQEKITQWKSLPEQGLRVVGFYRSQTRPGLSLDDNDLAVMDAYFPDPADVFLLIRPSAEGSVAGFFFGEEGQLRTESPYLTFPFERQALLTGDFPRVELPKPEQPAAPQSAAPETTIEYMPVPVRVQRKSRSAGNVSGTSVAKWAWGTAAAVLVILTAAVLGYRLPRMPQSKSTVPAVLQLQVDREGQQLRLVWDGNSPEIQNGTHGLLSVTDGNAHEQWALTTTQLAAGGILYSPHSNDVSFRMEVVDSKEHRAVGSVSAIVIPPEPAPVREKVVAAEKAPRPPRAKAHTRQHKETAPPPPAEPVREVATIAPRPSPFTEHPPEQKPPAADASEAKKAEPSAAQKPGETYATVTVEPVVGSRVGRAIEKVPLLRRLHRSPKESGFVPPQPLHRPMPVVPPNLRGRITGEIPVDVKLFIDAKGKVEYAELGSKERDSNKDFTHLAIDSALNWEFKPAKEGDQEVPSQVILHYRFEHPALASNTPQLKAP